MKPEHCILPQKHPTLVLRCFEQAETVYRSCLIATISIFRSVMARDPKKVLVCFGSICSVYFGLVWFVLLCSGLFLLCFGLFCFVFSLF